MTQRPPTRWGWRLGRFALVALSAYYLYRAINYRFIRPDQLGPSLFNKQLWYFAHLITALPVIIGAPLQFIPSLRTSRPALHRRIGRVYVIGATIAGLLAIYLGGIVGEYEGSRLPIVLLGCLWLFFTLAAWRCAVRRDFTAHRLFMIRSYGMALVLVWLRLMFQLQDYLFFYVKNADLRDTTREWASWVVPLLVLEFWISWWPLLKGKARAKTPVASSVRVAAVLGFLVVGGVATSVAQQHPSFAGEWVVADSAGRPSISSQGDAGFRTGSMGSGWGSPITITQDSARLTLQYPWFSAYDLQPPIRLVYRLDGAETSNGVMIGHAEETLRSRASWQGTTLVLVTVYPLPDKSLKPEMGEVRQTLSLEAPNRLVVEITRAGAAVERTVYTKR